LIGLDKLQTPGAFMSTRRFFVDAKENFITKAAGNVALSWRA